MEHAPTRAIVTGERAFLRRLEGGCQVPIAGHGIIKKGTFTLTGLVADIDGGLVIKGEKSGPIESAETIGIDLAEELLDRGASDILEKLKTMAIENNEG
jgi:hydroxymethylbilane synthase